MAMKLIMIFVLIIFLTVSMRSMAAAVGAGRGIGTDQSCHNFSHESWLPVTQICRTCHIPHRVRGNKTLKRYKKGLLWKKTVESLSYSLYNSSWSSSLTGIRDTSWTSPITGRQGGLPEPDIFNLHHFVSLEYDVTKAELRDPDLTKIGVSGPITEVLDGGKIQCSSCHDAHDEESVAGTRLMRVEKDKICLVCHMK
jgi:predicted CXXCH cytochrome family protein